MSSINISPFFSPHLRINGKSNQVLKKNVTEKNRKQAALSVLRETNDPVSCSQQALAGFLSLGLRTQAVGDGFTGQDSVVWREGAWQEDRRTSSPWIPALKLLSCPVAKCPVSKNSLVKVMVVVVVFILYSLVRGYVFFIIVVVFILYLSYSCH